MITCNLVPGPVKLMLETEHKPIKSGGRMYRMSNNRTFISPSLLPEDAVVNLSETVSGNERLVVKTVTTIDPVTFAEVVQEVKTIEKQTSINMVSYSSASESASVALKAQIKAARVQAALAVLANQTLDLDAAMLELGITA